MGRSVSVPYKAVAVSYAYVGQDGEMTLDDMHDCVANAREVIAKRYRSAEVANHWLDRESLVFCQTGRLEFGLAVYSSVLSLWAVPRSGRTKGKSPGQRWMDQLAECFGRPLRLIGTFSNGESVYEPVHPFLNNTHQEANHE